MGIRAKSAACRLKHSTAFDKTSCLFPPQHTEPGGRHRGRAAPRGSPPAPRCGDLPGLPGRNTEHERTAQGRGVLLSLTLHSEQMLSEISSGEILKMKHCLCLLCLWEGVHPALKSRGSRARFPRRAQAGAGTQLALQPARERSLLLTSAEAPDFPSGPCKCYSFAGS